MKKSAFVLLLFLFSCWKEKPPVRPGKMALVLMDLHIAEAHALQILPDTGKPAPAPGRNLDSLALFYQSILHHHGMDTADFRRAMDWYVLHPEQLDSVYKEGIAGLDSISRKP